MADKEKGVLSGFTDMFQFDGLNSSRPPEATVMPDDDVDDEGKETTVPAKKPKNLINWSDFGRRVANAAGGSVNSAIQEAFPKSQRSFAFLGKLREEFDKAYDETKAEAMEALGGVQAATRMARRQINKYAPESVAKAVRKFNRKSFEPEYGDDGGGGWGYDSENNKEDERQSKINAINDIVKGGSGSDSESSGVQGGRYDGAMSALVSANRAELKVMGNMGTSLAYQTEFFRTTFTAYIKQDLELKYRTLFATEDLLEALKAHAQVTQQMLDKIRHNTGLPDSAKSQGVMSELADSVKDQLMSKSTDYISNFASRFIGNAKDAISAPLGMLSMLKMTLGDDMTLNGLQQLAFNGKTFGGWAKDKLARGATKYAVKQILARVDPSIAEDLENKLSNLDVDIPMMVEAISRGKRPDIFKHLPDSAWNTIQSNVAKFAPSMDRSGPAMLKNKMLDDPTGAGTITNRFVTTVEDIIPGYLRLQTRFLESIATGRDLNEVEERAFSFKEGKMSTSRKILAEEVRSSALSSEQASAILSSHVESMRGGKFYKNMSEEQRKDFDNNIIDVAQFIQNAANSDKFENIGIDSDSLPWLRDVAAHGRLVSCTDDPNAVTWYDELFAKNIEDPKATANAILELLESDPETKDSFQATLKKTIKESMRNDYKSMSSAVMQKNLNDLGYGALEGADVFYQLDERGNRRTNKEGGALINRSVWEDAFKHGANGIDRERILKGGYKDYNVREGRQYNEIEKRIKIFAGDDDLIGNYASAAWDAGTGFLRDIGLGGAVDTVGAGFNRVNDALFGGVANAFSDGMHYLNSGDFMMQDQLKPMYEWATQQEFLKPILPMIFTMKGDKPDIRRDLTQDEVIAAIAQNRDGVIEAVQQLLSFRNASDAPKPAKWLARAVPPALIRVAQLPKEELDTILNSDNPAQALNARMGADLTSMRNYLRGRYEWGRGRYDWGREQFNEKLRQADAIRAKYVDEHAPDYLKGALGGGIEELNAKREAEGKPPLTAEEIATVSEAAQGALNAASGVVQDARTRISDEYDRRFNNSPEPAGVTDDTSAAAQASGQPAPEPQPKAQESDGTPAQSEITQEAPAVADADAKAKRQASGASSSSSKGVQPEVPPAVQDAISQGMENAINNEINAARGVSASQQNPNNPQGQQQAQAARGGFLSRIFGSGTSVQTDISSSVGFGEYGSDILDTLNMQLEVLKDIRAAARRGAFSGVKGVVGGLLGLLGFGKAMPEDSGEDELSKEDKDRLPRTTWSVPKWMKRIVNNPIVRPFIHLGRFVGTVSKNAFGIAGGVLHAGRVILTGGKNLVRLQPAKGQRLSDTRIVITPAQFREGIFFDKECTKRVKSIYDIRGPVFGRDGQPLFEDKDWEYGLVDASGRPLTSFMNNASKLLHKGLVGGAKLVWKAAKNTVKFLAGKPLQMLWQAATSPLSITSAALVKWRDIRSKRNPDKTLLTAKDQKEGLVCFVGGKELKDSYHITRPVIWKDIPQNGALAGQEVISQLDIDAGLTDSFGNPLNTFTHGLGRTLINSTGWLGHGIVKVAQGLSWLARKTVKGLGIVAGGLLRAQDPYIDVFVRKPGFFGTIEDEPRLQGILIRRGVVDGDPEYVYADGTLVKSAYGIKGAVYSPDYSKTYIKEEELDRLCTRKGKSLTKWAGRSILGKIVMGGTSLVTRTIRGIANTVWKGIKFTGSALAKAGKFLTSTIWQLGAEAVGVAYASLKDVLGLILSRGKLVTRDDLAEIVGDRLDKIYDLLDTRMGRMLEIDEIEVKEKEEEKKEEEIKEAQEKAKAAAKAHDTDGDGVREGSYQDRVKEKEAEAAKAAAKADDAKDAKRHKELVEAVNKSGAKNNSTLMSKILSSLGPKALAAAGIGAAAAYFFGPEAGAWVSAATGMALPAASAVASFSLSQGTRLAAKGLLSLGIRHPVGAAVVGVACVAIYAITEWNNSTDLRNAVRDVRGTLYGLTEEQFRFTSALETIAYRYLSTGKLTDKDNTDIYYICYSGDKVGGAVEKTAEAKAATSSSSSYPKSGEVTDESVQERRTRAAFANQIKGSHFTEPPAGEPSVTAMRQWLTTEYSVKRSYALYWFNERVVPLFNLYLSALNVMVQNDEQRT